MRNQQTKFIVGILLFTTILTGVLLKGYGFGTQDVFPRAGEPKTTQLKTSTKSIYSQRHVLQAILHYQKFTDLIVPGNDDADEPSVDTYAVQPGLKATRTRNIDTGKIETCTGMTPQGVTPAGKYLLTTAYDHYKHHASVIYVQSLQTHRFLKTIVLKGHPHVGGIAYDKKHGQVLICGRRRGQASIIGITMKQIERYQDHSAKPITYDQEAVLGTISRASYVTVYHNQLYVGLFKRRGLGYVQKYRLEKDGGVAGEDISSEFWTTWRVYAEGLTNQHLLKQIQGLAVYKGYLVLSQSYGSHHSRIYLFKEQTGTYRKDKALMTITAPPHLEQITAYRGKLYLVFEGAAQPYRHKAKRQIDRVLTLDIKDVVDYYHVQAQKAKKAEKAQQATKKVKTNASSK
ncbi:hypothetical protein [Lacticaseibacillus porcinae]|uniref:hypothetical protein n=1 Tax=Lacticaseibacillus porcinae TaxID=1123687 RepID=UPI000F77F04F|nr:hypothetical protein [Lacticaseibacillus porcinae]